MFTGIKRPLFAAGVFLVCGIAEGLPETPGAAKLSAIMICAAFIGFIVAGPNITNAEGINRIKKGRGNIPLLFLSAEILILALIFSAGFFRAGQKYREYSEESVKEYYESFAPSNPGEFDYGMYLKANGIKSEEQRKKKNTAPSEKIRDFIKQIFDRCLTEKDSGIIKALITGDKGDIDDHISNLYQSSGISHLLAISGLHISILGMGLFSLLKKFRMGTKSAVLFSSALLLCFLFISGEQKSAERAVIMLLTNFLSVITGRKYDMRSALCIALSLLCFNEPYLLFQSGFQLSFFAVGSICFAGDYVIKEIQYSMENYEPQVIKPKIQCGSSENISKKKRITQKNRISNDGSLLISSFLVQIFTLPVIVNNYFTFPLYAFILNLIVIPLITVVMYSGLSVLCLGIVFFAVEKMFMLTGILENGITGFLIDCAATPGHYILNIYEVLCRMFSKLPFSTICFGKPGIIRIVIYYAAVLIILLVFSCKPKSRIKNFALMKTALAMALFLCSTLILYKKPPSDFFISAVDVGQGDCFYINDIEKKVLIDGGCSGYDGIGKRTIEPFLLSQSVMHLDAIIISHADEDHTNGIMYLLSDESKITADTLYLPSNALVTDNYDLLKEAFIKKNRNGSIKYLETGDIISLGESSLTCLYSGSMEHTDEINRHSEILLLENDDFRMLFTGDCTKEDEEELYRSLGGKMDDIHILKAGHHGSKTSTSDALLKMTKPKFAILSYGKNNRFKHPSKETLDRLSRYKVKTLSTALSGEIRISLDENRNASFSFFLDSGRPKNN